MLVSCRCIWSVYARRNDAGTMISVVISLMLFVVRSVAQGVQSQVLFSVACCVKGSLKRSSISRIVLDGALVKLGFCSMLKIELV